MYGLPTGRLGSDDRLARRRSQVERRVLHQDLLLQLTQLRRRLDPQLVDQHRSRPLERPQRLRLTTRSVQRQHVQRPQPLAIRMLTTERLELGRDLAVSTRRQISARHSPRAPTTGAPRDASAPPATHGIGKPGERRAPPQPQSQPAASPQPLPDRSASSARPSLTSAANSNESSDERSSRTTYPAPPVRSPARATCATPRRNPARCGGRRSAASRPTTRRPGHRSRRPSWVMPAASPAPPADGHRRDAVHHPRRPQRVAPLDHAQRGRAPQSAHGQHTNCAPTTGRHTSHDAPSSAEQQTRPSVTHRDRKIVGATNRLPDQSGTLSGSPDDEQAGLHLADVHRDGTRLSLTISSPDRPAWVARRTAVDTRRPRAAFTGARRPI